MADVIEKRKSKRFPVKLELNVSQLFKQEQIEKLDAEAPITVVDVSREGIGFKSTGDLPLNYYFNARLELSGPENTLFCVVQIIRKQQLNDGTFSYGCIFIGMASVLNYIFDDFERKAQENETI